MDRDELLERYRRLVGVELPERARRDGWVLRLDHCFGRVLLDAAVGGCWYDVLDRRSAAYRQLDDARLAHAVTLGERLLAEGDPLLRELDAQSLAWRGKPQKRPRSRTRTAPGDAAPTGPAPAGGAPAGPAAAGAAPADPVPAGAAPAAAVSPGAAPRG